jgi:hypothetical protein
MTIHLVDKDTEFNIGQFMCVGRCSIRSTYGTARQISDIRGSRLYFDNGSTRTSWIYRREIAFLCDSEAEANAVIALSLERERRREEEVKSANERVDAEFAQQFSASFGIDINVNSRAAQHA